MATNHKRKQQKRSRTCTACNVSIDADAPAPKCVCCEGNNWHHFCQRCEPARLLRCDGCAELHCSVCQCGPDIGITSVNTVPWRGPCSDVTHRGQNIRFCEDCAWKCPFCGSMVCENCFHNDEMCRACTIRQYNELQAFDAKRALLDHCGYMNFVTTPHFLHFFLSVVCWSHLTDWG
jgi:hypothetical protein